jgi:hypothetical protein
MRWNCVLFNRAASPPTEANMGKHPFQRIFKDLLSLHGYPLPFESIERITGAAETPDYGRGYGNGTASAQAFPPLGKAPSPAKRPVDAGCVAGGCA